jgi:hypothetical protein
MVTLYRAASRPLARKGTHFSPSQDVAIAYQNNPGFGGSSLYRYEVSDDYHLDLYKTATRRGNPEALRFLAETLFEPLKVDAQLRDWKDAGYQFVFQVLENERSIARRLAEDYDWVSYLDDFPAGAETWRYLGDALLEGTLVEPIRAHAVRRKTNAQLDAEIATALSTRARRRSS